MKKLKVRIGLAASSIEIIGNYMFRRPKHSRIEVVAPKEEEYLLIRIAAQSIYQCIMNLQGC